MPQLASGLSDLTIKKAKPRPTAYTLADGNGLHLTVSPAGKKSWTGRYRNAQGKQNKIVIGEYPNLSLADARSRTAEIQLAARVGDQVIGVRELAKRAIAGADDANDAEASAQASTFNAVSEAWLEARKPGWADESYRKARYVVRQYLQPAIGAHDMGELRTKDVTELLRGISVKAPSLAKKAVQYLNGIVDFSINEGIRDDDKVLRLRNVLPAHRGGHVPAVTRERDIGPLMRAIQTYDGFVIRSALLLAA